MIYRIRFSSIKNKWFRRPLMVISSPAVLIFNWCFVFLALLMATPGLLLRSTVTSFDGFLRVWNGERIDGEDVKENQDAS